MADKIDLRKIHIADSSELRRRGLMVGTIKYIEDDIRSLGTGSQGEAMSALYRMANNEHRQVSVNAGDRIIISASAIPGNETMISRVIDGLFHM